MSDFKSWLIQIIELISLFLYFKYVEWFRNKNKNENNIETHVIRTFSKLLLKNIIIIIIFENNILLF